MKTRSGLWLDHRKAVIVTVKDKIEETHVVSSMVEKQLRRIGDSPLKGSYEPHQVPADNSRERKYMGQLDVYYEKITASIHDAEYILIFGPGEAKRELKTHLENNALGGRIAGVETADKMTDRQIAAKVRKYFA